MMNKLATVLLAVSTAGCATESDGVLTLSGQLADASRVTHVVAANPLTGERVVVDLKSDGQPDGRFEIAVPTGDGSWIVTFADANQKGAAMKIATLQTGGLDAFRSTSGGAIDFGTVHFDGRYAHGTTTWNRLAAAFGESETALQTRAKLDNLALRYSNPDIDANGKIDALEGHAYRLEVDGTLRLQVNGLDATISDLVNGLTLPTVRYMGTTIEAAVPRDMGMNMLSGTMQFEQNFYGTAFGDATPMVPAGARIGQPHIKFGELDGSQMVGLVASGKSNAPSGTYKFGFDQGELTFSDVFAPDVSLITAASDFAVPFVRIRTTNATCKSDCDISAIDVQWMRSTKLGWMPVAEPRDAKLDLIANMPGSKRVHLAASLTDGATSQDWRSMPIDGSGLVRGELAYVTTTRLCYVAVSYISELGMKMTSQTVNPGCF